TGPVEDGSPQLDMGEGRVWLRLPRIGYCGKRDALREHASRPGSPWASVALVSPLRELARQHHRNGQRPGDPVFDPRRGLGRGQDGDEGGDADTLVERLARSTPRWLVHHGLPAVLADLVAGRFRFTTLATSAYVNVSESTLARAHARAASAFWTEVLK